ncbi:MAG: electron transfer flavoprotein subunit beta/FixA family protein [Candidatus Sericytochromatia bacterium]
MNIVVCMKQTPDTEAKIVLTSDGQNIEKNNVKFIISSYDELALEEGIRIKEKFGGTVTVITIGTDKSQEQLKLALAMGADSATQIWDPSLEKADSYTTAKVLSKAIQNIGFDIVLCGQQAIDTGASLVAGMLAERLDVPCVHIVKKIDYIDEKTFVAHRQIEGGEELLEINTPCLITAQDGLNVARYPKLPDIMKAKKKELKVLGLADLGLNASDITPKVSLVEIKMPEAKKAGKILTDGVNSVPELVRLIREETKVI